MHLQSRQETGPGSSLARMRYKHSGMPGDVDDLATKS